jgi:3-hydroxymyristoyl/3-hydroxydecanoyl-(acyl carrier protein) dehydratase
MSDGTGFPFAAPLRAVDRIEVIEESPRLRLRTHKLVTATDPYMPGHFPKLTMLPAVFLMEGLRQALVTVVGGQAERQLELLEVRSARLLSPMLGGQEISSDITVDPVESVAGKRWLATATCTRQDGGKVATLKVLIGEPGDEDRVATTSEPPAAITGAPVTDHARIRELLPVRHPILLVDKVIDVAPGERISAVKAVTGSEPCYAGLPEGLPSCGYAYPRSLVFESFGQTSALLWLASGEAGIGGDGVLMLAAIRNCRFAGAVFPGDVLRHVVRLEQLVGDNAFLSGEIWLSDRCVASVGSLIAVNRRPEHL